MNWYKKQLKTAVAKKINLSNDDIKIIKDLIEEGNSFMQIAELVGVSPPVIARLNREYKWRDIKAERAEKEQLVVNLYLLPPKGKGMNAREIEKKYHIGRITLYKILEKFNLQHHWRGVQESAKHKYKDNPELIETRRQQMTQRYSDPQRRKEQSEKLKEYWNNIGGAEGLLLSYSTREQAIRWLNSFKIRELNKLDEKSANAIYNKYIQIINNHTYPDEIEQQI